MDEVTDTVVIVAFPMKREAKSFSNFEGLHHEHTPVKCNSVCDVSESKEIGRWVLSDSTTPNPSDCPQNKSLEPKLELEILTTSRETPLLMEHEWLTTTEWIALERVSSLLRVGVVSAIEPGSQFWVTEDLVRLINGGHLLLCLLLGDALLHSLVRVELLCRLAVGGLDLSFVSVAGNTEDLVVVLGLAALQSNLCLVEERVDLVLLIRPLLGGSLEEVNGLLVILFLEERLATVEKTPEGISIQVERLFAVASSIFVV